MKDNNLLTLLIVAIPLVTTVLSGCGGSGTGSSSTAVAYVLFGNPTTTGTGDTAASVCSGRGICKAVAASTAGYNPVSFQLQTGTPMVLVMRFSKSALSTNQTDQLTLFADASGTYQFQYPYQLSGNPLFDPLGLPTNSVIKPTDPTRVVITDDQIAVYITFSHS